MKLNLLSEVRTQLRSQLELLRPIIIAAAQRVYDTWEPDDEYDDFSGGGICDAISSEISSILAGAGIDSTEGGQDGDDHSFVIAYDRRFAYVVDIHHSTYESGGGYSWQKIPGVIFQPEDVQIFEVDRPDWIE